MSRQPPILLYHKITDEYDPDDAFRLSVSPQKFAKQMAFLAENGYRCLTLEEVWRYRHGHGNAPAKSFAITFDDGYLDNYTNAFPILQQYGMTATIFLVTSFVGKTIAWPHKQPAPFLSWEQINEMAALGMGFGGHTHTHPNLPDITEEELEKEIATTTSILAKKLMHSAQFFAYPGGHQTAQVQRVVQENGYLGACGVDIGASSSFNSWRVQVNTDDSLRLFQLKVSGRFEQLKQIRQSSRFFWGLTQITGKILNKFR